MAAESRTPVDDEYQRLLLFHPHQRIVELFGAGGGAAGAVDMYDHGASRSRPGQPVELRRALLVIADQSLDGDTRDIGAPAKACAAAGKAGHRGDGEYDDDDGQHAPEGELAPH